MRSNRAKQKLEAGETVVGISLAQLRSPEVPRMFAAAGLDWVFLDAEHGCYTVETLQDLIRVCQLTPLTPVVRVADFQYDLVARALDMGAEGIIFPRVESADVLEKALRWAKFPPEGVRGFGLGAPQIGYQNAPFDEITAHANRETLTVAQIESRKALDALDELASAEGLDCLLVGPADLSNSLGVGGQWDHPKLLGGIEQVVDACQRHGKWPGIQVRNVEFARRVMGLGMKLIGCANELTLLWGAVQKTAQDLFAARESA